MVTLKTQMLKEEKIFFRLKFYQKKHGQNGQPTTTPTDLLPPLSLESPNTVRKTAGLGFHSRFYVTIEISNGIGHYEAP